jgi:hypothetical protein
MPCRWSGSVMSLIDHEHLNGRRARSACDRCDDDLARSILSSRPARDAVAPENPSKLVLGLLGKLCAVGQPERTPSTKTVGEPFRGHERLAGSGRGRERHAVWSNAS